MTDDKLLIYNKQGLVPGPAEEEAEFIARAEYCLDLRKKIEGKLPFCAENKAAPELINEACQETQLLFDISPRWVPVFFSNYQLACWHGGCAWIFQLSKEEPTAAFFQLRRQFKDSMVYLGIYDRTELMAHELAHVGRMMFEEPQFEEVLAYRASKGNWRRWWGPLVQSSFEAALFVFLLLPFLFFDLYLLFSGELGLFWKAMWLKAVPAGVIVLAVARLWRKQRVFGMALGKLKSVVGDPFKAEAIVYRLTDREIYVFSQMSKQEVVAYALTDSSLRWHLIRIAYFNFTGMGQ